MNAEPERCSATGGPDAAPAELHPYRSIIEPVPPGLVRPLWSVMIPTYNCAKYLSATLEAVLAQDPGPDRMQIEVVDDGSSDEPAKVVEEVGRGRVGFFQQTRNVGHIRNFDTCLRRARGELVHLLHGDDLVHAGFYEAMAEAFRREPTIGAAFCRNFYIDESGRKLSVSALEQPQSGIMDHWLERLAEEQRIMTPAIVVRRAAYEKLGGFDQRLVCVEDWEMWMRVAAHFPVWYESQTLASYRMHIHSNTGRHIRSGEDVSFVGVAVDIFKEYLPPAMAARVIPKAKKTYALSALEMARAMWAKGDWVAVRSQIRAALGLSRSPAVWNRLAAVVVQSSVCSVRRAVFGRKTKLAS